MSRATTLKGNQHDYLRVTLLFWLSRASMEVAIDMKLNTCGVFGLHLIYTHWFVYIINTFLIIFYFIYVTSEKYYSILKKYFK